MVIFNFSWVSSGAIYQKEKSIGINTCYERNNDSAVEWKFDEFCLSIGIFRVTSKV